METSADVPLPRRVSSAVLGEIGLRIHILRRRQRRKQTDVARGAGLDQPTLSLIERGLYPLRVVQLYQIAQSLGVSIAELTPWPPPSESDV